jgi:phenylacetic acid degradation operon negative regulatory protein
MSPPSRAPAPATAGERPLTARSVIASTLLGMHPPRLRTPLLIRSAGLFGISEGTARTAISRMVAAGELEPDGAGYRLAGHLVARQSRQDASRRPRLRRWRGAWEHHVVPAAARPAAARGELRRATRVLGLAELRDGVWLRPDNLDPARAPEARAVVAAARCWSFTSHPVEDADPAVLAASLWDLAGWAAEARRLARRLEAATPDLAAGRTGGLRDAFLLSAAVLRHLLADPLLPDELLPAGWPGPALRTSYEAFDRAFTSCWRDYLLAERP